MHFKVFFVSYVRARARGARIKNIAKIRFLVPKNIGLDTLNIKIGSWWEAKINFVQFSAFLAKFKSKNAQCFDHQIPLTMIQSFGGLH